MGGGGVGGRTSWGGVGGGNHGGEWGKDIIGGRGRVGGGHNGSVKQTCHLQVFLDKVRELGCLVCSCVCLCRLLKFGLELGWLENGHFAFEM